MRWQDHPLRHRLQHPDTGEPLFWHNGTLSTPSGTPIKLEGDIPVLLAAQLNPIERHFAEHYRRDAELFDYWEERDPATAHDERRLREVILRQIPRSAHLVLDVGCGNGWLARTLVPHGIAVCSLDLSLVNTRRALEETPHPLHVAVVASSEHLPFAKETFDCVIASEVLEHLPEPERALEDMWRVVKPGGRIVISTPYKERIRHVLCIHCNQPTPIHAHLNSFDEQRLRHYLPHAPMGYTIFGNKALLVLRTYRILGILPHSLWRAIDWFANQLIRKPAHIVAWWDKR
ncbi:MAG: class I SAM-dependent methyltransferase [Bacteroidota bacterium]|nr:class I SAM-dependent methyltransferase [Candidatus Kapabacteria bacterium]MCS7302863.1 class I SAM-dependent methyltransferase [Candidatus Kapabacteria bacterium]MCX7937160.1 class I SAM-dependent methyltransferase [Chlorobiota bacterium]MDW8075237.1 class I SAM-dependent methyltransferase [Bacteroidota bacterium]MDW8271850.1 class I SAM-dependent methyltransferase [Bacteroidota bacterium]